MDDDFVIPQKVQRLQHYEEPTNVGVTKIEYLAGALISLDLTDFMNHAKMEMKFGPRVNIITGV